MKSLCTLLLFGLIPFFAFAQEKRIDKNNVPPRVIEYLNQNYSIAKDFEYYQKKDNDTLYYEVELKLNKQEYNLKFAADGLLLETEREIKLEDLEPAIKKNIQSVLADKFKSYSIKKVQELNPSGVKQFELNVKVKKSPQYKNGFYDLLFDSKGNLLRIEEEKLYSIESVF